MNWKSKIINDLFDLKNLNLKSNDSINKSKKEILKDVLKESVNNSTSNSSVNNKKIVPRNQRWKTSLINKIKEDILNNDSGKFADILKKINNDKKQKEIKRKNKKETIVIDIDTTKDFRETIIIDDDDSDIKKKNTPIVIDSDDSIKKNDTKRKNLIDDDNIILVGNTNKRKRLAKSKQKKTDSPKKSKLKENEDKENAVKKRKKSKKEEISQQPVIPKIKYPVLSKMKNLNEEFELTYIIRPNSKREHAENDDSVCIWDCAFEPTIDGQDASHVVATCGANTVSMIECHTGKVIAKYTNLIEVENYYSLDWTIIKVDNNNNDHQNQNSRSQYCPILAAGGQLGEIVFLNRMQGECFRYAEPKVSKPQPITQLRFSKDNPKWLFAGSEDKYVYLYDIGDLNDTDLDAATNLAKFIGLKKDPTAINVVKDHLIVGCSDGTIVIYNLSNIPSVEEAKKSGHLTNISISHKFSSLHKTYIDDIIPYFPQYHHQNNLNSSNSVVYNFFTRGAKDHITLWSIDNIDSPIQKKKLKKSTEKNENVKPTVLSELKWSHYVECVRFSIVNDEDETLLLTGSGAGDINIYKLQEDKSLNLISNFKHEQSGEAIHKVVLSKDKKYMVGVNEINLAFIWKLK